MHGNWFDNLVWQHDIRGNPLEQPPGVLRLWDTRV